MSNYILDAAGNPILEPDIFKWAEWFEHANRVVAKDDLPNDVRVSTVFLGIDHSFGSEGPPVLWETMIFGGRHEGYCDRYSSLEDALAGHREAVQLARGWLWRAWQRIKRLICSGKL